MGARNIDLIKIEGEILEIAIDWQNNEVGSNAQRIQIDFPKKGKLSPGWFRALPNQ